MLEANGSAGNSQLARTRAKEYSPDQDRDDVGRFGAGGSMPSVDHSTLSPSGHVSKRSKDAADERNRVALFGPGGLKGPQVEQPSEKTRLLKKAGELRDLASRGMKPRAYLAHAEKLENMAKQIESRSPSEADWREYIDSPLREAKFDRKSHSVRLVVLSEGLGNRRDKRYYGHEALESLISLINGSQCYMNHKSPTDEVERPEGDVWRLCGYWKDGVIQMYKGKQAVIATLCCTANETGEAAFALCEHALKYEADFPGNEKVFCGTSINGDGEMELRRMAVEGEDMTVNYVTKITDLPSADLVTKPARGGRVLALLESQRGSRTREEDNKMGKKWHALVARLVESIRGKKADETVADSALAEANTMKAAEEAEEAKREKEALRGSAEDDTEEADDDTDDAEEGDDEPDGDEVPGGAPATGRGKPATSKIKHEETHTYGAEADRKIRDLTRKLREAKLAGQKPAIEAKLKEAGVTISADKVLAMDSATRDVFMSMLEADRFKGAGETPRDAGGSTLPAGRFTKLAESIGRRGRGE